MFLSSVYQVCVYTSSKQFNGICEILGIDVNSTCFGVAAKKNYF